MLDLTFGEQVKIILSRKGMTIKELAEIIEERTGKKMSRQNLTQRLGRDNFQEQDMRMIAEILECPFQLSILADSASAERAANIEVVEPTGTELARLARAKERKEKRARQSQRQRLADAMEQVPSEMEEVPDNTEKEMTLGDYIEIHEELQKQETGELPVVEEEEVGQEEGLAVDQQTVYSEAPDILARPEESQEESADAEEVLRELEEMERGSRKEERKPTGWRAVFQRRRKNRTEERVEEPAEKPAEAEQKSYGSDFTEYEHSPEEPEAVPAETANAAQEDTRDVIWETAAMMEEDEEAEDLTRGEVNPYTGHEYESNSVRMHPKRIGYVQVYDRRDHAWTDMTEWAFLGYQERKKALLGKDYEPPIYLD